MNDSESPCTAEPPTPTCLSSVSSMYPSISLPPSHSSSFHSAGVMCLCGGPSLSQQPRVSTFAHARSTASPRLASVCEPLLRRQAWVERPLGSGSRYCRAVRWSILDRCSSTGSTDRECWAGGGRNQASGRSVFVYCLGVDLQTLRLSADFSAAFGLIFFYDPLTFDYRQCCGFASL